MRWTAFHPHPTLPSCNAILKPYAPRTQPRPAKSPVWTFPFFNPTPARTRDGKLSFRVTRPGGPTEWLGRSSVPGVRAAALLEQFDAGQGNVLLPGFGEGTEVENLLKTLEAHRLVFVWEADPVTIRLAVALHDYADALQAGRLVILQCPVQQLHKLLADWLSQHPDRQCPTRIMMWPWQSQPELDQIRSAVETAWHEASRQHT